MKSFGIVIACCERDIHYAKGCFASIRYFLRDVPVCFLVDGPASLCTSIRKRDPHVTVVSNDTLRNPWLRKACRGWGHTKMAALWEAPFETFLLLDADTCVWGDILSLIPDAEYDLIIDDPQYAFSKAEIALLLFHPEKLSVHFPEFDYGAYRDRYVCTGAFFFRRGAMDLTSYQRAWALQQQDSELFFAGEQGMLNFLVFHGVQKKELRVHTVKFQVIACMEEQMRLEYSPLCLTGKKPLKPAVLHFCHPKPHIFTRSARAATMNHFRLQYLLQIEGMPRLKALWQMALEDKEYIYPLAKRLRRRLRTMIGRLIFWPTLKRGLRKLMRLMEVKG